MNDPDLVSLRSNLTGSNKKSPGIGRSDRYEFFGGHQHKYSGVSDGMGMEAVVRSQEGQLAMYQEIAAQKIKYFKKIAHLEKLMEQVKGEKSQLAVIIETQKQNFLYQHQQQEIKHQNQLKDLKDRQAKGEVPLFKEKLDSYKREFTKHNLVVSEETYVELKSTPEQSLSLKEFI